MQRFVSLLLILLVLASQGFCVAHSHAGTSVVDSEGHSVRPHVHIFGGKHHSQHSHPKHKGNDSSEESLAVLSERGPVDHDSDAFYSSETQFFHDVNSVKLTRANLSVACVLCDELTTTIIRLCVDLERNMPHPLSNLKCPLYLQTLSIRC
ncbi:MAG: hypothetical protein QM501_04850 [Gimesia sp.]